jgi:hypothetical protein
MLRHSNGLSINTSALALAGGLAQATTANDRGTAL